MQISSVFCIHGGIVFLGIWLKLKWFIILNFEFSFGDIFFIVLLIFYLKEYTGIHICFEHGENSFYGDTSLHRINLPDSYRMKNVVIDFIKLDEYANPKE